MTITLHSLGYELSDSAYVSGALQSMSPQLPDGHAQSQLLRCSRQLNFVGVGVGSAASAARWSDLALPSALGATALATDWGAVKASSNSDSADAGQLLQAQALLAQTDAALAWGYCPKPVLLGPLTLLWSTGGPDTTRFDSVVMAYAELLADLFQRGVQWVQLDEPLLQRSPGSEPLPLPWRRVLARVYQRIYNAGPRLMLANHGGGLGEMLRAVLELPVAGLHIDAQAAPAELPRVLDWLPVHKVLSIGLACEPTTLVEWQSKLIPVYRKLGERLWLAPVRDQPQLGAYGEDGVAALVSFRAQLTRFERRRPIISRSNAGNGGQSESYQAVALAALSKP